MLQVTGTATLSNGATVPVSVPAASQPAAGVSAIEKCSARLSRSLTHSVSVRALSGGSASARLSGRRWNSGCATRTAEGETDVVLSLPSSATP